MLAARSSGASSTHGWLNLVGGCCGTTAAHIGRRSPMVARAHRPRPIPHAPARARLGHRGGRARRSSNRPLLVGERTNVIGSPEVQGADRRRRVRGGGRDRPRAGARRRAGRRRLPAGPRPRRARRHRAPSSTSSIREGQGAADDRLDRRRGDRARAHLVPGQGDHQLDQPRGRRGALREGRAARRGASARRWSSGCIDEDRAGHGGHRASASSRSRGAATRC